MLPKLTLVALGLSSLASASLTRSARPLTRCGAPEPSREQIKAAAALLPDRKTGEGKGFRAEPVTVATYFHVVSSSEDEEDGNISDEAIADQLQVMNDDYRDSGFSFFHADTTRTVDPDWATNSLDPSTDMDMKGSLRQGSYADLNIYLLKGLITNDGKNVLGRCYFPMSQPRDEDVVLDGCSVLAATVPGGSMERYNLGKTVSHEVGHWMGLYHTFHDGCDGGDGISDTPAQASPTEGCPPRRDSCPNHKGLDPIHNFMDYSDDVCLTEFTPLQM
ncbi:related to Extracellular metalloprotease MGG_08041 [Cephalotrichum gorgonifer]|uniref:Related to Extracellular metalloprotease MGG_08041 n=1 Tax=Cephalotrichum gorgonifer TaxID=2041049 RepID=A0AAE8MWB9_9PEZI|nr:related to Extracellular metalloprotease MGG_08041 [Cephalotrichum gorgonifer]